MALQYIGSRALLDRMSLSLIQHVVLWLSGLCNVNVKNKILKYKSSHVLPVLGEI